MRHKRNFRGQSGRLLSPLSNGGQRLFTSDINCCCTVTEVDDVTGETSTYYRFCTGTTTAGVADCRCCANFKGKGGANTGQAEGLFGG